MEAERVLERIAERLGATPLLMEGIALTGAWVDKDKGLLSLIALELGVSPEKIASALASFKGVGRRFQQYGEMRLPDGGTITLVDDYGHHPAEMEATLEAARRQFEDD